MSSFVFFVILVLATGALTAPAPANYDEECGIKTGIAQEEFYAHLLGGTAKCYLLCVLEKRGVMKDGHFNEEFRNTVKRLAEESEDDDVKSRSARFSNCFEAIKKEGCEAASDFYGCLMAAKSRS